MSDEVGNSEHVEIPEPGPEVETLGEEVSEQALDAELAKVGEAIQEEARGRGNAAVITARGELGTCETGDNGGVPYQKYVRHFGNYPPSPWCAFFVSWAFDVTGARPPWQNPGYVGSINQWARAHDRLVSTPQHGDIFGLGDHHCGLVAGSDGRSVIYTVEGNCSNCVKARNISFPGAGIWFARF